MTMKPMGQSLSTEVERRIGNYAEGRRLWGALIPKHTVKRFLKIEFRQEFSEARCREIFEKHREVFRAPV